jgi:hypothetical protein
MNRKLLEKSFAPEQIRQCKGNFGSFLGYVEGHTVIQRLNDILDEKWSFEVLEKGGLRAGAITKNNSASGFSLGQALPRGAYAPRAPLATQLTIPTR